MDDFKLENLEAEGSQEQPFMVDAKHITALPEESRHDYFMKQALFMVSGSFWSN